MSFPANYIAEDDVESFVQNGNVFFNARYLDVNWKYEQLIDFQFNQVVENKVVNTVWTNLGITGGVTAAINTWYPFKSVVLANGNNTILKTY
jgi:ribose 1,5-bisphosphokinase PhnN